MIEYPKNQVVKEGAKVTLRCKGTGIPEPNVTWAKIEDRSKSFTAGDNLTINSIRAQDSGTYECKVSNNIGDPIYSSAHVLVTGILGV